MARSRHYLNRMVAKNAQRFEAPIHAVTNDFWPAPLEDVATIHGTVESVGISFLHLSRVTIGTDPATAQPCAGGGNLSLPWGAIAGLEWLSSEAKKSTRQY